MYMWHSRFPHIRAKLEKQKYGPFHVAWKINDNAYVLQLSDNWNTSHTFNVVGLFSYHPDGEELYERYISTAAAA